MNEEEFFYNLGKAFNAGYDRGRWSEGAVARYFPPDFDDWYEEVYGGPDCE
jgi:hypothetical protein